MPKAFPGEAPELDSLTAQRGRSHTKTAPGCRGVFRIQDVQARTKDINRGADSGRRHRSPVGAGLSGKKTQTRIQVPKTFPGESLRKYFFS